MPHDDQVPPAVGSPVQVRLDRFPSLLFAAAHEQWESLLREYSLRGLGGALQSFDHAEVNCGRSALNLIADASLAQPDAESLSVSVDDPSDFALLQAVLHDARRLSLRGDLLSVPTLPEIAALRNWFCEQVPHQAAGAAPEPWQPDLIHDDPDGPPVPKWDSSVVPPDDVAWVLADDHNRIVDASAAGLALLGWSAELVGQRLLAIIPPALREAHIAGFLRSAIRGDSRLLGTPLPLPALREDGSQTSIWLTISRHDAHAGRLVFVGRLEPRQAEAS